MSFFFTIIKGLNFNTQAHICCREITQLFLGTDKGKTLTSDLLGWREKVASKTTLHLALSRKQEKMERDAKTLQFMCQEFPRQEDFL